MSENTITIHVAGNHLMTGLLGERDEYLRIVEDRFPAARMQVRGNQVSIEGDRAAEAGKVVEELVLMLESGQVLDKRLVTRTVDLVEADERPSEVFNSNVFRTATGRTIPPKVCGSAALPAGDHRQHHHLRHRPRRYRQELVGRGHGPPSIAGRHG